MQAYCSYAWESSLRALVLQEWEKHKSSDTFDDDEDPQEDANSVEDCIPLAFKLKVVKEAYDRLPQEEKKEVDRRREEDKKKMYRKIPEIEEDRDRIEKLRTHQKYSNSLFSITNPSNVLLSFRNQPLVAKSLLRVLTNLEDQAGCVAQVLIASVDPAGGSPLIQKYVRLATITTSSSHV